MRNPKSKIQVTGESPSGKAAAFEAAIPRFESWLPSHFFVCLLLN